MKKLTGYRTIIIAGLGFVWSILAIAGIDVPADDQANITTGILSAAMLGMRLITRTAIGENQ